MNIPDAQTKKSNGQILRKQVQKPDLTEIEERLSAVENSTGLGQVVAQITEQDSMKLIAHGYPFKPVVTVVKDNGNAGLEQILCDVQYVSDTMIAVSWNGKIRFNGWIFLR
ncbi:MAG: hypothetical protein IJ759_07555 [Bacteroidales bacterium]|nr:hypothetical protein [Bacteroidales bacterium]